MDTSVAGLVAFIREHAEEILGAWEQRALTLPGARTRAHPLLRDDLPRLLEAVAACLDLSPTTSPAGSAALGAAEHLLQRAEVGAGLRQVIREIMALRDTIERAWPTGASPDAAEALRALRRVFDEVVLASATRHSELHMHVLEAVERMARGSARQQLDEILRNILTALIRTVEGIDTAAILLRDKDVLTVRAAIGLTGELATAFSTRIGEGFAGSIAAERWPRSITLAANDPTLRSPALRMSGVRVLYGVPIQPLDDGEVIGVAHIGSKRCSGLSEDTKRLFRILVARASGLIYQTYLREQLERDQSSHRAVVENSPAIIFSKDLEGRYLTINHKALAPLGLEPEDFIGRTDEQIFPEPLASNLRAADLQVVAYRATIEREEVVTGANGTQRDYLTVKFPLLGPHGVVAVAGIATDITDRIRWREGLRLLAEAGSVLSASLVSDATVAEAAKLAVPAFADCCIVDLIDDGALRRVEVVHRDPAKAALADQWRNVLLDRRCPHLAEKVLETGKAELFRHLDADLLERVAQSEIDRRLLRHLAPTSMIQVPLAARGRQLGALAFVVSGARRTYDEIDLQLAVELGRRVSQAIDNARLYERADEAIRLRDEVLELVAHDLRSPVSTISMAAQSLHERLGHEPTARRFAETILVAGKRMKRLVADLLDEKMIELGRLSITCDNHPPAALLQGALDGMRGEVNRAEMEAVVRVDPDLPEVHADRERILQVLENLLANAIEFGPSGSTILLGAEAHPPGKRQADEVRFFVTDSGRGIPPSEIAHLFDRYWQARRPDRRGTGLGLAICKGIVERHRGRIWAESEEGSGSTFWFTLPTRPDDP